MKKIMTTALWLLLIPVIGFAHPGHGETGGYTIIHYFVEPQHAVFTWSFLIATLFYLRNERKKKIK